MSANISEITKFRVVREIVGLNQIALSRRAAVSRMRLQMAEADELVLRPEEISAIRQELRVAIECRAEELDNARALLKVSS